MELEATSPGNSSGFKHIEAASRNVNWPFYLLVSLLVILPCLWSPLVSSVDAQSHLYNAWLSTLVDRGQIQGLVSRPQTTNIVVDIFLSKIIVVGGVSLAERLVSGLLILTFFWGAFRLVWVVNGRAITWILPWLAILAYGFVFQMGFLNYYLSCGIVLWVLSLLWGVVDKRRLALALPLTAIAYAAHPLPVLWLLGVLLYVALHNRFMSSKRLWLFIGSVTVIAAMASFILLRVKSTWMPRQLFYWSGADQALLYGPIYLFVALAFLSSAAALIFIQIKELSKSKYLFSLPLQIWLLMGVAIVLIPFSVGGSDIHSAASHIPDRLSLLSGVLLLVILGRLSIGRWTLPVGVVAAGLFFFALHHDIEKDSRIEARMHQLVGQLDAGQRVVFFDHDIALGDTSTGVSRPRASKPPGRENRIASMFTGRLNDVHLLSRACLGHCYDYMNYEPSTGQFRLHALPGSLVVLSNTKDDEAMAIGHYVVKASDLPLFALIKCGDRPDDILMKSMKVGDTGSTLQCK